MLSATRFDYKKFESPFGLPQGDEQTGAPFRIFFAPQFQKRFIVFDVGETIPRIHQKLCAPRLDPKVPKTIYRF
jgi:hypothetical protein